MAKKKKQPIGMLADGTKPDAVLTLDPASSSNAGLAFRPTSRAFTPTGRLRAPEWFFTGSVWNSVMHDELTRVIAKWVPRGGRVLFGATATAFYGNALDIGRAIGAIEGILHDVNVLKDEDRVVGIQDMTWRKDIYEDEDRRRIRAVKGDKERRQLWKDLAIATVYSRYKIETDDNASEAILINDYFFGGEP